MFFILQLKTKLQETEKLKGEILKLEQDRSRLEEERDQAQAEVAPYKFQINDKCREKTKITQEKEAWIEAQNNKVCNFVIQLFQLIVSRLLRIRYYCSCCLHH